MTADRWIEAPFLRDMYITIYTSLGNTCPRDNVIYRDLIKNESKVLNTDSDIVIDRRYRKAS